MPENIGHVVQVAGPAVDVQFTESAMPPIYEALKVVDEGFQVPTAINVILEVQQHLGEGRVRCIAMEPTDGMVRGMQAIDQGGPISVPVGRGTLGYPRARDERNWRDSRPARANSVQREDAHSSPSAAV